MNKAEIDSPVSNRGEGKAVLGLHLRHQCQFLGALAKLRKTNISFVMSVRLFAWNNSTSTGRMWIKFDIRVCFENLSRKFNFH